MDEKSKGGKGRETREPAERIGSYGCVTEKAKRDGQLNEEWEDVSGEMKNREEQEYEHASVCMYVCVSICVSVCGCGCKTKNDL